MSAFVHLRVERRNNVTVVHLADSHLLERVLLNELHDELVSLIEVTRPEQVLISFGYVQRLGTEAVNTLLTTRKRIGAYGGQMRLCDLHKSIHEIFKVLQLDGSVFNIYTSTAEALATFD
jgi:anti-anti-sigma factor